MKISATIKVGVIGLAIVAGVSFAKTADATTNCYSNCLPSPTVSISAKPVYIKYKESSVITWSSRNATRCTAIGGINGWAKERPTSGTFNTGSLTSSKSYTITCYNGSRSATKSVRVFVSGNTNDDDDDNDDNDDDDDICLPTVNLTADRTTINAGESVVLKWTSKDAKSCSATWTESKATSGTKTVSPNKTVTYSISCTGEGGKENDSVKIIVKNTEPPVENPSVELSADDSSVPYNGSTTLRWESENATSCTASGGANGWLGSKALDGSFATGDLKSTKTYTITCYGNGKSASDSVTVSVGDKPIELPTVNITADETEISYNTGTILRWTSENATSCYASGGWSGSKNTNGSASTGNLISTKTYKITCTNEDGDATDSVTVSVGNQPPIPSPSVEISAEDDSVPYDGSTTITWESEDATSCYASGAWSGSKGLNGSFPTGSLKSTKTYKITCHNGNKSAEDSVTVYVGNKPPVELPSVELSADDSSVPYNGSTTLRWESENATSCTASGGANGWLGSKALDGSFATGDLKSTKTYTITCYGNGKSASDSVTVSVGDKPETPTRPTARLSITPTTVKRGGHAVLTWYSTNTTSCEASWLPNSSTSGSKTVFPEENTTYTIICTGPGGDVTESAEVSVKDSTTPPQEEIYVEIDADESEISEGESTYINWYSENATSCAASGGTSGWAGYRDTSGSFYTGDLSSTKTYSIRCSNGSRQSSASVTVYVDEDSNNGGDEEPSVSTRSATDIEDDRATLNGFVDSNDGGDVEAWFEWGEDEDMEDTTSRVSYGNTSGTDFDYELDGLDEDTTYYFRAVAENEDGDKVYGSMKSFTTDENGGGGSGDEPNVTTYSAEDVDDESAMLSGYVDTNGEKTRVWFEWGERSGDLYEETDKSSYSSSSRNFDETIYDLEPDTTYYFRAMAENQDGDIDRGNVRSFRTDENGNRFRDNECDYGECAPTAVTTLVTNVGQSSARLNGLGLSSDYSSMSGHFEWGTTPALGFTTVHKGIGSGGSNTFYESLFNLVPNRIYYYRAVVENEYGESEGDILSFKTLSPQVVIDTPVIYRNTTVVTTSSRTGTGRPSLVFLSVSGNDEIIRRGEYVEYAIEYKNVSSEDLRDVVLRVSIPKELEFVEASRGYFSEENSMLVVNIGDLFPQEEGSILITVRVDESAEIGKIVVVTANLAYTIDDTDVQEEVFAYSKNTVELARRVNMGGLAFLFGDGFLPGSLLGWLLLLLLIVLIILALRKAFKRDGENRTVINTADHTEHH